MMDYGLSDVEGDSELSSCKFGLTLRKMNSAFVCMLAFVNRSKNGCESKSVLYLMKLLLNRFERRK